jgi:outer membrane protein assembly factor BamB
MLERVLPPPPATNRPLQIAVQARSKLPLVIVLCGVLIPVAITTFVVFAAARKTRQIVSTVTSLSKSPKTPKTPYVKPEDRPPSWQGTDGAIILDVNHDGTPDIIGRGRQVNRGDIIRVIALDGSTGRPLWQSEPIGTYTATYQAPLALAGTLIVVANDAGKVQAFAVSTGANVWSTTTPERVKAFCSGEGDAIIAVGADNMLRPLARADGTIGNATPAPTSRDPFRKRAPCTKLPSDDETPFQRAKDAGVDYKLQKKLGVFAVAILESPGGRVMGGARNSGTRVTTLIGLGEHDTEKWRVATSKQPLTTDGAPVYMAITDRDVCATFTESGHYRLACFALADGAPLWDADAPTFISGLQAAGRSLLVTTNRGLEVRDIETGAKRWQME